MAGECLVTKIIYFDLDLVYPIDGLLRVSKKPLLTRGVGCACSGLCFSINWKGADRKHKYNKHIRGSQSLIAKMIRSCHSLLNLIDRMFFVLLPVTALLAAFFIFVKCHHPQGLSKKLVFVVKLFSSQVTPYPRACPKSLFSFQLSQPIIPMIPRPV